MRELEGKTVVVIGGSAGIGYATAEMAALDGARLVIAARGKERLEAAATRLAALAGERVRSRVLDVARRDEVRAFLAEHAPFDHLVLPGSTVQRMQFDALDESRARTFFDSKFWGPFWAAYDARERMSRGGSIVFYSGAASRRPLRGYVVGAAVDGAIDALTRSLAWEFGRYGLRVNCVSPGIIDTEMVKHGRTKEEYDAWVKEQSARVPLGRLGLPEECAKGAIYLMTNEFVTGVVLAIDGGAESAA
ncbi:MAG: SDR family NAD(P)-dependent oxidoreductase [Alphaproteobacteria bacterium]